MKQHELYCSNVAQANKLKSEFLIAGLTAKMPWDDLEKKAKEIFTLPSAPAPPGPLPPSSFGNND